MRGRIRAAVAAAAMMATVGAGTAAQAGCWNAEEASAATIRDFQSLLMVAALRCQVTGHGMSGEYNGFLRANKATIQAMNDRLKVHFIRAGGPVGGQQGYDAYTTQLANAYGASASDPAACAGMAALAREAEMMAGSAEGLLLLAARQGVATRVPEGRCEVAAAMVVAAAVPAPAASPVPAAPAVTLVLVAAQPAPAQVLPLLTPPAPVLVPVAAAPATMVAATEPAAAPVQLAQVVTGGR